MTEAGRGGDGAPRYAQARRAGEIVFISGQVGRDASGALVADEFERQAEQVFANLIAVLASHDAVLGDVIKITGMLAHPEDRDRYSAVLDNHFPAGWPAHTLIVVSPVDPDELLEIEAVAYVPERSPHQAER
jgi:enamine deaminase RidA (YjgF/YER057c/UK114 family)